MNQSFKILGINFTVTSFVAVLVWVISVLAQKYVAGQINALTMLLTTIATQVVFLIARFKEHTFDFTSSTFWMGVAGTLLMGVNYFSTPETDMFSNSATVIIGALTMLGQMFGINNIFKRK